MSYFFRDLYFKELNVDLYLYLFKDLRSMLMSLMSRKRKCSVCGKIVNEFKNKFTYSCLASKPRYGGPPDYKQHKFNQKGYIVEKPLVIFSSQPSSEFRTIRNYIQDELKVSCRVTTSNWKGGATVMLKDDNYNVSLFEYDNIMNYLRFMYNKHD